MSGTLDMAILDPITSLPQFRGGRIKVFAVMAKSRTGTAPDIPTVDEAGAPGLYISPWQAVWAPKGTPKDVIAKLNAAVFCPRSVNRGRFDLINVEQACMDVG